MAWDAPANSFGILDGRDLGMVRSPCPQSAAEQIQRPRTTSRAEMGILRAAQDGAIRRFVSQAGRLCPRKPNRAFWAPRPARSTSFKVHRQECRCHKISETHAKMGCLGWMGRGRDREIW